MNLQGKLSGLKGLVSHSPGKRRFKGDLSADMISPPLGDFRHTMHVGRGGDAFGDTSFLSNHGGTANGGNPGDTDSTSAPDTKIGVFFSRTLRHVRKTPERSRAGSKDLSPPPPPVSPIIKNAVSLPRLDVEPPGGSPTAKVLFPNSTSLPETNPGSYDPSSPLSSSGLESAFVTLPRLSRSERQQPSISGSASCSPGGRRRGSLTDAILSPCSAPTLASEPDHSTLTRSDSLPSLASLASFTFDLGPSLMSEVFGLIDSSLSHPEEPGQAWEREEAGSGFGLTSDGSEMDSATISYVDSLLREDGGSIRKSPYGVEWEEYDEGRMDVNGGGPPFKGTAPDLVMGSPGQERIQCSVDVLAGHYVGEGLFKGKEKLEFESDLLIMRELKKKVSYGYADEEEEIKV
ncbi:cdc42 effector protein 1 [Aplochiton taeniatus]